MKRYAELIGFTEEEAAKMFENAKMNGANFFLEKPFMVLPGARNYKLEFKSQRDLNIFNKVMQLLFIEKRGEQWVDLLYNSNENAEKKFETLRQSGVKFRVLSVECHPDDYYKNYRLKFPSQRELNRFRKVCFPD